MPMLESKNQTVYNLQRFWGKSLSLGLKQTPCPAIQVCIVNNQQLFASSATQLNAIYWLKHERYERLRKIQMVFYANEVHQIGPLDMAVPKIENCVNSYEFK